MAEDEVQDFSKLSLEERCQHKNWKARVSAYDELVKTFKRIDDDKEWSKYASWVRKFPTDSNAAAQEKALEVALLFFENAGLPQAGKIVAEVMSGVVSKCITAAKAKSKELAGSIALMCVEIEKYEVVQEELMKGMEQKNPKVVTGCISILTDMLKAFGPKVINLKTAMKKIPVLIEDRDKGVRDETKKLLVELSRWLGPSFKTHLTSLKPLVVQEIDAEMEKITEKPKASRLLRSQQIRQSQVNEVDEEMENGNEEEEEENVSPDIDPYDLLDPVDILSKLPKDFYEKCESKKWQERKEALESLQTLAASPKLEVGDYADLVRMLKKTLTKDSNVVVVALSGKCLALLASGLKKKFHPYASSCISAILEKFKEKKANVVAVLREAIDASFVATNWEAIQTDTVEALQNKNPAVKVETNAFLSRAFAKTAYSAMSDKKLMKPYFTAIVANLNESDPAVREAAAEALGVAMKHVGEKFLSPYIADMEPIKLQKVKEFMDKAVITAPKEKAAKAAPKAAATGTKPTGIRGGGGKPGDKKQNTAPKKVAAVTPTEDNGNAGFLEKTPPSKSAPGGRAGSGSKTGAAGGKVPVAGAAGNALKKTASSTSVKPVEEALGTNVPINNLKSQRISDEMKLKILKWNFSTPREEFVELLKELMMAAGFGPTLMANMFNTNFKLHLKALDILQEEFVNNSEGTKCNLDLILKWATLRFFDTNPSVLIRILDYMVRVFGAFSEEAYVMSDIEASAFIPYLVVKLGEPKENIRTSVKDILRLICKVHPSFKVFGYLIDGLKAKNAKQRTECLEEMSNMIKEHGMGVMSNTPAIHLKEIARQIADRDNSVRSAALNGIVEAYFLAGEKVFKMIGQLADKDQSLLDERIKRAAKSRPVAPPQGTYPSANAGAGANTMTMTKPSATVAGSARVNANNTVVVQPLVPEQVPPYASPPPPSAMVTPVRPLQSPNRDHSHYQDAGMNGGGVLNNHNDEHHRNLSYASNPAEGPAGARSSALPEKYRIDFDAIDRMFNDNEPVPPLELLETNIDQFVRGEQITIPKRRTVAKVAGVGSVRKDAASLITPSGNQSIDMMVVQLGDINLRKAIEGCVKLEKVVHDSETAPIMGGRVDSILSMVASQFRRQQPNLEDGEADQLAELNKYFRSAVTLLTLVFKNEILPRKAKRESLNEIIYQLLVLIVDENLERLHDAVSIIRLVNVMVVRIIENSDPNSVSCALIRLLNDTLNGRENPRLLELVMKCQWKLLKQYHIWTQDANYEWDVKSILLEYHSFIQNHPFSWFQNRDGTPLKTVKTIIHALILQAGCGRVQQCVNELPELKNSEAGLYLNKIFQRENSKPKNASNPAPPPHP